MTGAIGVLLFILGLLIGSFLNAYIYRLSVRGSVWRGRSYCPQCQHQLSARDLIPLVSFIALRRACRYCRKKISWQYPLVELATALSWVGLFWYFGLTIDTAVYCLWTAILIVIFVYDLKHQLILDRVTIPAGFIIFITAFFLDANFVNLLLAGIIGGSFFLIQYLSTKGRWVGGGDIRLGVLMGLMLGWPKVLLAIAVAYIIGAFVGMILLLTKRKKMDSHIPFGTFLTLATYLIFFIGDRVIENYFR
ncbi:MAG: prepilin peptidase [Patescibacteria group bacterium]